MKIKDFRLWQRGISNDRAIKLMKIKWWYEMRYIREQDCNKDNIKFWEDPIENMYLEKFVLMHSNDLFQEFIKLWWSILKASDTSTAVLDNIAKTTWLISNYKKKELEKVLEDISLWEIRYMGKDQRPDLEEYSLQIKTMYEESRNEGQWVVE